MPKRIRLTEAQLKKIIEQVMEEGDNIEEDEEESNLEVIDESPITNSELYGAPLKTA